MKYFVSKCINNKNKYKFYVETKIFPDNNLTIDGFMFMNDLFLNKFNLNMLDLLKTINNHEVINKLNEFIKYINFKRFNLLFDYSNGYFTRLNQLNLELIARKILKYQSFPYSCIILVSTNWCTTDFFKNLPLYIKYKDKTIDTKDVFLISPYLFAKLIGLTCQEIEIFKSIITYNINKDLEKLNEILELFEQDKNSSILSTEDLFRELEEINLNKWLNSN